MHTTTFEYLKPTDEQIERMSVVRAKFAAFVIDLDYLLPNGADKTYVLRHIRESAMWANVSITREADGTPRL